MLLQLVAKTRLGEFKDSFGSMGLMGTMKFVSDIAGTKISELNPIITRNVDRKHLLSRSFYSAAFKYREEFLTRLVAQRLSKRVKGGMDSFDAVNECQPMMVDMAKAYVERLVLDQFIKGVKEADKGIQKPLMMLERLYALSTIEAYRGWYLEMVTSRVENLSTFQKWLMSYASKHALTVWIWSMLLAFQTD